MMPRQEERNRLGAELSPYLLQHAENPVHWQPWDETSLAAARTLDRPILLSVGYSACHWCHVMAHESFEDAQTAQVMNKLFVCIKVDREERPDLDQIYQSAYALMNGRGGGWPLTIFLSPQTLLPFFAGTYYPKEPRLGMPAFLNILQHVEQLYRTRPDAVAEHAQTVADACQRMYAAGDRRAGHAELDLTPLHTAIAAGARYLDAEHGGFGGAPKFPMPAHLDLLLHATADTPPAQHAGQHALYTLECMARSGLWDHLGGGFYRYSVDARWEIPHFEKMLYDNAGLLLNYSHAWRLNRNPLYVQMAHGIVAWLRREMTDTGGAFYAALDADDTAGEEGGAYAWTREQVQEVLGDGPEYRLYAAHYGLDGAPNFEGRWHLREHRDPAQGTPEDAACLEACRTQLLAHRTAGRSLLRDDKIITAWNGQAIQGLAYAARACKEPDWLRIAADAMDFIRTTLYVDGVLMRTCCKGQVRYPGYLDDHAMALAACLELLQGNFRRVDLDFAVQLADALLHRFENAEAGGFYYTAKDHERLPLRPRGFMDDAQPSGNGVAARSLLRLGLLLGRTDYLAAVERTLQGGWEHLCRGDIASTSSLLCALSEYLRPFPIVVLRGAGEELQRWQTAVAERCISHGMVVAIPADAEGLPDALAERRAQPDTLTAYLCIGQTCQAPQTTLDALLQSLEDTLKPTQSSTP